MNSYWSPSDKDYQSYYNMLLPTEQFVPELPCVPTPAPTNMHVTPVPSDSARDVGELVNLPFTTIDSPSLPTDTSPTGSDQTTTIDSTIGTGTEDTPLSQYGFRVEVGTDGPGWLYDHDTNYLFAAKNKEIKFTLHTDVRPPDAARIRIKVIYSRHEERVTRGQVKCVNNCKSRRFFTIILPSMWNYCEDSSYDHDDSVVIPITALHELSENCYLALLNFNCQSSCLMRKSKQKSPDLELQFYLLHNDDELGCAHMNLRVCSGLMRDYTKYTGKLPLRKRAKETSELSSPKKAAMAPSKKIRLKKPAPASNGLSLPTLSNNDVLNVSRNVTPDKDGYYHFHWKGKSLYMYNLLNCFKLADDLASQEPQ